MRHAGLPRAVLVGLVAALAFASISACGGGRRESIQVAVVWTGYELERFQEVVDRFERANPEVSVDVVSSGDDLDGFLRARSRAGGLPDVALLPQPGLIADYVDRGWLEPLDVGLANRYHPFWQGFGSVGGELYGVAAKASFKSLLWFRPDLVDESQLHRWSALPALVRDRERTGGPALLAVGAANGWPLSDWLENALLARDGTPPALYQRLAAGEDLWCERPVAEALVDIGRLWGLEDAFPGGGERALLTDFDESVIQVAAADEARLLVGNDFVQGVTSGALAGTDAETGLRWVRLPSATGREPALLGGDYAVVMTEGYAAGDALDETAHDFVDWLTRGGSFDPWIRQGGYYSPLKAQDDAPYPDPLSTALAELVRTPPEGAEFDLSDRVDRPVRERMFSVLQAFFVDVAGRAPSDGRVRAAADRAMSALNRAVGGEDCGR